MWSRCGGVLLHTVSHRGDVDLVCSAQRGGHHTWLQRGSKFISHIGPIKRISTRCVLATALRGRVTTMYCCIQSSIEALWTGFAAQSRGGITTIISGVYKSTSNMSLFNDSLHVVCWYRTMWSRCGGVLLHTVAHRGGVGQVCSEQRGGQHTWLQRGSKFIPHI